MYNNYLNKMVSFCIRSSLIFLSSLNPFLLILWHFWRRCKTWRLALLVYCLTRRHRRPDRTRLRLSIVHGRGHRLAGLRWTHRLGGRAHRWRAGRRRSGRRLVDGARGLCGDRRSYRRDELRNSSPDGRPLWLEGGRWQFAGRLSVSQEKLLEVGLLQDDGEFVVMEKVHHRVLRERISLKIVNFRWKKRAVGGLLLTCCHFCLLFWIVLNEFIQVVGQEALFLTDFVLKMLEM